MRKQLRTNEDEHSELRAESSIKAQGRNKLDKFEELKAIMTTERLER